MGDGEGGDRLHQLHPVTYVQQQAEDKQVLAAVARRTADGLDGGAGHRHADKGVAAVRNVGFDVVGIVIPGGSTLADPSTVDLAIEGAKKIQIPN